MVAIGLTFKAKKAKENIIPNLGEFMIPNLNRYEFKANFLFFGSLYLFVFDQVTIEVK